MSTDPASGDPDLSSPIRFGTDAFDRALDALVADRNARTGTHFIFHDGTREQRQQALARLTRHATGNVHQFEVPSLLADRHVQTQNNLRKAFDHAAEERALLYLDRADALFVHEHSDAPDDDAVPSTREYVFDRVAAYDGLVVLGLQRRRHVERAQEVAHLVVTFE